MFWLFLLLFSVHASAEPEVVLEDFKIIDSCSVNLEKAYASHNFLGLPYNIVDKLGLENDFTQNKDRKIYFNPVSKLAYFLGNNLEYNDNGWPLIYIKGNSSQSLSLSNRQKILDFGYKIVAFSEFGAVEAVENANGDIFFLDCSLSSDLLLNIFM